MHHWTLSVVIKPDSMKTMDQWWMGTIFMTLSSFLLKAKIESFQEAQNLSITHLDDVQRHPPKWDFYQLTRHRGFAQTSNIETWLLWTKWCCTLHQPPFSLPGCRIQALIIVGWNTNQEHPTPHQATGFPPGLRWPPENCCAPSTSPPRCRNLKDGRLTCSSCHRKPSPGKPGKKWWPC